MLRSLLVTESKTAIVLGAGASRGVSYAHIGEYPSPLDSDFFDLLQRLPKRSREDSHKIDKDDVAVSFVLKRLKTLPHEFRRSLERTFYTLQLRAFLEHKLTGTIPAYSDARIMSEFARAIQALLRKAHGKEICKHHEKLFRTLSRGDVILSFNYDLVAERALRRAGEKRDISFGPWIYAFEPIPANTDLPLLLKLHGSSNWKIRTKGFESRTTCWDDFDRTPGYRAYDGEGTVFPIFLPFWDKRIEEDPWLSLWRTGCSSLQRVEQLVVWGYSLAPTDVKSEQLFSIALGKRNLRLCVIDPSPVTRRRWRELFADAQFWEYTSIGEFFASPPRWTQIVAEE
jgi:hypothetical protein